MQNPDFRNILTIDTMAPITTIHDSCSPPIIISSKGIENGGAQTIRKNGRQTCF